MKHLVEGLTLTNGDNFILVKAKYNLAFLKFIPNAVVSLNI